MMKSFFKKLAFVMALAMVVTMAAPAAQASAADALGIVLQNDDTWTVKETDEVEVGATVDYRYKGAPKNYKELDPTWASSKEDVATVDKNGLVTTLKAGETVISISLSNGQKGEIKLTVKAAEVDNSFVAKQTTDTLAELTFANTAITQADLEKGLTAEWVVVDDFKATQPIQVVSVKDGVAVVNVYGFNDGVKYVFTYGEETATLDATIGEVASIEVKAFADANCSANLEHVAYVGKDAYIKYTLKNAKGVDITNVALANNPAAYIEYKLGTESTTGEYWLNDMTGTATSPEGKIYFTAANKSVAITAKYVTGKFDQNTGLPVEGPSSAEYTVFSTPAPAYRFTSKLGFTVNGKLWAPTSVLALDDELKYANKVEFKLKDSNGAEKIAPGTNTEGSYSFKSTVPSVAFVDPVTGAITTNTEGSTTVLCYFKPNPSTTNPNPVATLVAAETITVVAKRGVDEIIPGSRAVVVSTAAGDNNFNKATFTVKVEDKLNDLIDASDIKVERNKATLPTGITAPEVKIASAGETGKYTVTVLGSAANVGEATSYLFTYEIKAKGAATQTFTVTVRQPIKNDSNVLVVSGYEIVTNNVTDIKTDKDANAKALTATVNVQSNAVSVNSVEVAAKPSKDYISGKFYYTVTKDGSDITNKSSLDGNTIKVDLTTVATAAAVSGAKVVNKGTNGTGTYVITVYQGVGATANTTTQALSTIQTKTVVVGDTQKTVSFVAKNNAEVANLGNTPAGVAAMVLNAYSFQYDGKTFGGNGKATSTAGTIVATVDYKAPATLEAGDVIFVRSVTFYVMNEAGAYTTNKVTINDYITVK